MTYNVRPLSYKMVYKPHWLQVLSIRNHRCHKSFVHQLSDFGATGALQCRKPPNLPRCTCFCWPQEPRRSRWKDWIARLRPRMWQGPERVFSGLERSMGVRWCKCILITQWQTNICFFCFLSKTCSLHRGLILASPSEFSRSRFQLGLHTATDFNDAWNLQRVGSRLGSS